MFDQYLVRVRVQGNTVFKNVLVQKAKTADHACLAAYYHLFGAEVVPSKTEVFNVTKGHQSAGPFPVDNICNADVYAPWD